MTSMVHAFCLFASTFILVFALGIQSLNVVNGHKGAAIVTSFFISTGQLVLYKLAPSADWVEIIAFLSGGPWGIYAAMEFHPSIVRIFSKGKPRPE